MGLVRRHCAQPLRSAHPVVSSAGPPRWGSTRSTRSVLKMNMLIPTHPCISAAMGIGDAGHARGVGASGAEVWPRACLVDQSWCAAPATRMGPPLTESPGRCRVDERVARGASWRQTRPRDALERVLKGWRERRATSGAARTFCRTRRASGAPSVTLAETGWVTALNGTSVRQPPGLSLHPFETGA